jgi:uncharacterized membrane protein
MMAVIGPIVGLISGLVLGLFAFVAARIMRASAENTSPARAWR